MHHGESLLVCLTTDSYQVTFTLFTQSNKNYFCMFLILIIQLNEFLTVTAWKGDIQIHFDTINHLVATKKNRHLIIFIFILPFCFVLKFVDFEVENMSIISLNILECLFHYLFYFYICFLLKCLLILNYIFFMCIVLL